MNYRRARLKCWIALCQAILEGRKYTRVDSHSPVQLSLI